MTACDFASIRCFSAARKASSLNGTSGISAKFTSWLATVAPAVMKPAWRPMSFTSPMPPGTLRASVCAQSSTRAASSTALKNPKVRETKAHIVVDRLRHADDGERVAAVARFLVEIVRAALRAVAADGEEDVHAARDEILHRRADVHRAARGAENRAALLMNAIDELRRDLNRLHSACRIEPAVAAAKAEHLRDAIAVVQFEKERADDVVEAGAQTTTRHDAGARLFRIEEELRPRPGQLELQAPARHRFRSALGCGRRR